MKPHTGALFFTLTICCYSIDLSAAVIERPLKLPIRRPGLQLPVVDSNDPLLKKQRYDLRTAQDWKRPSKLQVKRAGSSNNQPYTHNIPVVDSNDPLLHYQRSDLRTEHGWKKSSKLQVKRAGSLNNQPHTHNLPVVGSTDPLLHRQSSDLSIVQRWNSPSQHGDHQNQVQNIIRKKYHPNRAFAV
ncbi:uncharacterized protein LOC117181774 isoform X2 [Belonocnema kinseyi]|uniref:uncharacterized protein LOC117181774 isoform X2 n=1 Tax=Belonocnema kinseyi TaxID=2817044 RepID=UPI00143D77B6|nr:uncharacterized protein LOC117181774 isoform X2 [Belonocnema kinseyi]XP_033230633.1 uncharacterized protein LOC117181774 isoform X2 [Belonocnema kinseyi]